jgi:LysR family transcriptional regulator, nitrogen assimilation regulatory protein
LELRQLRYLIGIIDYGSFSKASAQLHVAQPALSQQIAHLEIELHCALLVRTSQGVVPTEAGLRLYRHAQTILRQVAQARTEALGEKELAGSATLGLPTSAMTILALPLLHHAQAVLPDVRLKLVESLSGHLLEMLLNGRLDCAILFRDTAAKGITVEKIAEEDLYEVSATANESSEVSLKELANVPHAIPSHPHRMRDIVEEVFRSHGVPLNIVAEVDSLPTLRGIAASGFANVILPQSALVEPSAEGRFYARLIVDPVITRPLALCRPQGISQERVVDAVADCLKQVLAGLIKSGRWQGARLATELKP